MKNSTLIYCLEILKIEKDTELYRKALELQKVAKEEEDTNEWISAMKIIANAYSSYIFSQSQLSDFLTLSAKAIEGKTMSNVIFKMYSDIMENYENFSHSLKSNYPGIIVDVISILHRGVDTKGSKVNPINIERYYQLRKQQAITTEAERKKKKKAATTTTTTATAAAAIHKEKILLLPKDDLVEKLSQITNRDTKELEESLARLQYSDLKKISQLCRNYSKLQYYSKLITKEDSQEEFKNEIQRALGRKLISSAWTCCYFYKKDSNLY